MFFTYFSTLHSIQFRVYTKNSVRNVILALSMFFLSFLLNWFWMPNWIIVFTNVMCVFLDILLHICFTEFMHDAISFNEFLHFESKYFSHSVQLFLFALARPRLSMVLVYSQLCSLWVETTFWRTAGIFFGMAVRSRWSAKLIVGFTRTSNCVHWLRFTKGGICGWNTALRDFWNDSCR